MTHTPKMRSIWYFVGLVLLTMGGLVFLAAVIDYIGGTYGNTVLAETRPGLWWGGIMLVAGVIFFVKNRNSVHD